MELFLLLKYLNYAAAHNAIPPRSLLCRFYPKNAMKVARRGKWGISRKKFSSDWFGAYCSGAAFILTNDMPRMMYDASLYLNFFWIDDYYLTGPLARSVNVNYLRLNKWYLLNRYQLEKRLDIGLFDRLLFIHLFRNEMKYFKSIWNDLVSEQLVNFPSLVDNGKLCVDDDFDYIPNFKWSNKAWEMLNKKKIRTFNFKRRSKFIKKILPIKNSSKEEM